MIRFSHDFELSRVELDPSIDLILRLGFEDSEGKTLTIEIWGRGCNPEDLRGSERGIRGG